jgi:protein phosphatase-4 regulatory subunit 3
MGEIVKKLLLLLLSRETFLRIGKLYNIIQAALRLFRTLVGTKEEFYIRIILKNDVLNHVFDFCLGTKSFNNLMNSACLEFFEFIRKVLFIF